MSVSRPSTIGARPAPSVRGNFVDYADVPGLQGFDGDIIASARGVDEPMYRGHRRIRWLRLYQRRKQRKAKHID
jgi:hypothetical protein